MPKIKMPRSTPSLDMTPMVDLAFLLVTFFMLTASFRLAEPVVIKTPSTHDAELIPDNVLTVTVSEDNRAFFEVTGFDVRRQVLEDMGKKYKISFTEDELKKFAGASAVGVPIAQLKTWLDASGDAEKEKLSTGIPYDSLDNQLNDWVLFSRLRASANYVRLKEEAKTKGTKLTVKPLSFALKVDGNTNYQDMRKVVKVLTDQKVYTFKLITELEK